MAKIDWLHSILCASPAAALAMALSAAAAQTASPVHTPALPSPASPIAVPQSNPEDVGDAMMARQRYQAAIEAFGKAPRTAAVWNKTGIAYQMLFDLKDAERCYKLSLRLDSKDPRVINNLATVYDSLKQYRKAEKTYRKSLKIDRQSAIVHKNLGTNLLTQHKYKQGWEAYQTAIAIDPGIFQDQSGPQTRNIATLQERGAVNYYMARSFVRAGEPERAIRYLRMAMNEGFIDAKKVASDSSFESLRGTAAFQQLVNGEKQH